MPAPRIADARFSSARQLERTSRHHGRSGTLCRQDAGGQCRPRRRGRVVRRGEQGEARRGRPRLRETAHDDVRAEGCGFRERGTDPCIGIRKNPRRNVARSLDTDELARLGRALGAREAEWPEAVAAIRLLALNGCRRGEVVNLRCAILATAQSSSPIRKLVRAPCVAAAGAIAPRAALGIAPAVGLPLRLRVALAPPFPDVGAGAAIGLPSG